MTPKEKAKEIFFKMALCQVWGYGDSGTDDQKERARGCAVACVDEILKNFEDLHKPELCAFDSNVPRKLTFEGEYPNCMTGYDMIEYFKEVKSEIEKL